MIFVLVIYVYIYIVESQRNTSNVRFSSAIELFRLSSMEFSYRTKSNSQNRKSSIEFGH